MNQKLGLLDNTLKVKRDSSIDILRAIALMGIVAAHMEPSIFIIQLRSFDVPMMVFLSGVVYQKNTHKNSNYCSYVVKRFIRIIVPTWIFLLFYFSCIEHYSLLSTIKQFPLMTSWYVWIMRVFFIIALFAPLIHIVLDKVSVVRYLTLFSVFLVVNELICKRSWAHGSSADTNVIVVMNLAYILMFSWGYMINRISNAAVMSVFFYLASVL